MNLISGKITVKGPGTGIPDLQVVIYDMDPAFREQNRETASTVDDNLDQLYRDAVSRFWIDLPGERLGSVLTDSRGRFKLEFKDSEFKNRNTEKRPDIILMVFAPEEPAGSTPLSKTPQQRLLHYSWIPHANSGRIESYSIQLDTERLDRFGIGYPGAQSNTDSRIIQLQNNLRNSLNLENETLRLIRDQINVKRIQIDSFNAVKASAWKWLMPFNVNNVSGLFNSPSANPQTLLNDSVQRGLENLGRYRSRFKLFLTDDILRQLGIVPGRDEVRVPVCDIMALKGFGNELVRVRSLLDKVKQDKKVGKQLGVVSTSPPSTGTDEPAPVITEPLDFIKDKILGQISELPSLKQNTKHSTFDELKKIHATINQLELSGGPANVTAFHDFYSIQIAFKNIWTAAFDDSLRSQVMELYRQTVKLHDEYGLSVPDTSGIEDINQFRNFLKEINDSLSFADVLPVDPDVQECYPQIDLKTWNRLDESGRSLLRSAAYNYKFPYSTGNDINPPVTEWQTREYLDEQYERALKYHLTTPLARSEQLILDITERLSEPYQFHYFAPYSVNYGILLTYRQEWRPETYQVGRLTATIPLAPGEKRTFKITSTVKKSRAQKEIEKALLERTSEKSVTSRAELDVISRVATSTNFRMTTQGTINLGIGSVTATNEFGMNQSQESTSQAKAMNEATRKSSEKVRQERETVIEETASRESSSEATHEISNPNNELTVTYLLYELERRYTITTHLHALTPVIMVAMDLPAPHEITDTWILEHSWILRRSLLDDQFNTALDYIEEGPGADYMDLEIKKNNWQTQKNLMDRLESALDEVVTMRDRRRQELIRLTEQKERAEGGESKADDVARAIFSGGLSQLFGDGNTPDRSEILEAQRKAVGQTLEYIDEKINDLQGRLSRSREVLEQATREYSFALKEKAKKDNLIYQLKLHIRQNILHYFHCILDYKHHDELLLELYHREVPFIEPSSLSARLRRATAEEQLENIPGIVRDGVLYIVEIDPPTPPDASAALPTKPLIEIADLNKPLGYKGNYIIFPLKRCSHITTFMSQEYIDDYFGVRDPGLQDGYTAEELLEYASAIWNDPQAALSDSERDALRLMVLRKLNGQDSSRETIIVPTGQLYMEALKGEQTLLEDFKLAHRGLDVIRAQEEIRELRLENLRYAQRLTSETPVLDEPSADKVIIVKGNSGVISIPAEGDER